MTNQLPRMSMLAVAEQAGGTRSASCGICQSAFRIPIKDLAIVRPPGLTIEWIIDVGGYCPHCPGYRCERHIGARNAHEDVPGESERLPIIELFCQRCNRAVAGEP